MASYAKLVNGLEELNLPKIQENLGTYTEMVNQGDMSFTQALEELVSIECSYKKERLNHANIQTTMRYAHTMREQEVTAVEALANYNC